jgi:hypothetical protein
VYCRRFFGLLTAPDSVDEPARLHRRLDLQVAPESPFEFVIRSQRTCSISGSVQQLD